MKKHGIFIKKHRNYQTKFIYNNGHLMMKYDFQPLNLNFKNEMVNDINQHFCEGWRIDGLDLSDDALYNRIINHQKPMGVFSAWDKNIDKLYDFINRFNEHHNSNLFVSDIVKFKLTNAKYIIIGHKGKLKDLFDLKTLENDYLNIGIKINIDEYSNLSLIDFLYNWDDIDMWVTGLILGYPIENTISLYLKYYLP